MWVILSADIFLPRPCKVLWHFPVMIGKTFQGIFIEHLSLDCTLLIMWHSQSLIYLKLRRRQTVQLSAICNSHYEFYQSQIVAQYGRTWLISDSRKVQVWKCQLKADAKSTPLIPLNYIYRYYNIDPTEGS